MISNARNQETALKRLRKLASSGLPLEPFVLAAFDIMDDAVPSSPLKVFWVDVKRPDAYILNSPELYKYLSPFTDYFVRGAASDSGLIARFDPAGVTAVWGTKSVWPMGGWALPSFLRTDAFNLVIRPLGWKSMAITMLHEDGEAIGTYPIWRSSDQRAFSKDDMKFMETAAAHLACGLRTARIVEARSAQSAEEFLPSRVWGTGVVLMDRAGGIIALDEPAQLIFGDLATHDGIGMRPFDAQIQRALQYVGRITTAAFADPSAIGPTPVLRLYSHWTGSVLKLRGALATALDGREYVTVLLERGESLAARERRMMIRFGLSQRELEVLRLVVLNKTNFEIAKIVGAGSRTVGKHVEHILQKLSVENRASAAQMISGVTTEFQAVGES